MSRIPKLLNQDMQARQAELIAQKELARKKFEDKNCLKKEMDVLIAARDFGKLERQIKKLNEQKELIKEFFLNKFTETGTKYFENKVIKVTYVPESEVVTLDSKGIKENYPEIAAEFSRVSTRKSYVLIKQKDKEKDKNKDNKKGE